MCVCVCEAKPVAVELRCHATALILVIGKAQFRRAMLSCDSSCSFLLHFSMKSKQNSPRWDTAFCSVTYLGLFCLPMSHKKDARLIWVNQNLTLKEQKKADKKLHMQELNIIFSSNYVILTRRQTV